MTTLDEAIEQLQLTEVFSASGGELYEWDIFVAWVAPSGRYYWYADAGCSCRGFGEEYFTSISDFSDGDRAALERAFRSWYDDRGNTSIEGVIEGMEKLRRLRP